MVYQLLYPMKRNLSHQAHQSTELLAADQTIVRVFKSLNSHAKFNSCVLAMEKISEKIDGLEIEKWAVQREKQKGSVDIN